MELRTLGALNLPEVGCSRPKALLLLGYLTLEGPRDRRHLSRLFFPDAQDRLGSLRTTVRRLRREVPGGLMADRDPLRAALTSDAQAVLAHLDVGELRQGVNRYAGAFLDGARLPALGEELEEWLFATREFLAARVRAALITLADTEAALGDFPEAVRYAERAAWLPGASDLSPEEFVRLHALLAAGQSAQLERLRREAREYGLDLRPPDPPARRAGPVTPVWEARRAPFPVRGTSFVGREGERGALRRTLARPEVRLVTLVGPGGIGKTRLALEVARVEQRDRPVTFVSLEAVPALDALPNTVADALGATVTGDLPPLEALAELLRPDARLLVLDSAEHLLVGAPQLARLLRACPALKVLVTSRERLGMDEEWVLTLDGLQIPTTDAPWAAATAAEAVQLFAQRAKRARLNFDLTPGTLPDVLRICRLVGGSPLGVELAAAWVKLLSVREIADEIARSLDLLHTGDPQAAEKHHSVRAVFEQTWARLTPDEQRVLARLSVFRGGFTREAAREVAGATLATLGALLDKSLIRSADDGRHDLHALLRQFARERLDADPAEQDAAETAHGLYFLAFSQVSQRVIVREVQARRAVNRIEPDLENIRLAAERFLQRGDLNAALQCLAWVRIFFSLTGRALEARARFIKALALASETRADLTGPKRGLMLSGQMSYVTGDHAEAQRLLEAALTVSLALGPATPPILLYLGRTLHAQDHLDAARGYYEWALARYLETGDPVGAVHALCELGALTVDLGDVAGALGWYGQALALSDPDGADTVGVKLKLGQARLRLGHLDEARRVLREAVRDARRLDAPGELPHLLEALGRVEVAAGDGAGAVVLLGAGAALYVTATSPHPAAEAPRHREKARAQVPFDLLNDEVFSAAWDFGWVMTPAEAVDRALGEVSTGR